MTYSDQISDAISSWFDHGFDWAENHCSFAVADYALSVCGRDPAAEWRGKVNDEKAALKIMADAGGNMNLIDRAFTGIGWKKIESPDEGDVVVAQIGSAEIAGICLGKMFAFLADGHGVLITGHCKIMGSWRCA